MPDPEWNNEGDMLDERKFTVGGLLAQDIEEIGYQYDFGDGWEHQIVVEKRSAAQADYNTWPMCIAGANACPPEDVGGPPGYMAFLEAMRTPAHEDHLQMWRWNAGPFDPSAFSANDANRAIRRLR